MRKELESYFLRVIKDKKKSLSYRAVRSFLRLLSLGYQVGVTCRNIAFDYGWLSQYYPPVPVVMSIGNIVAGGTGKTPVTHFIAEQFIQEFTTAILSRGYRSPVEHLPMPIVLSKGNGPLHPATYCGDEPYLLSQNLPQALIFVGKDRHKASDLAVRAGAQLILLDDGMQHRRLARDFEVVVIDSLDPFGHGYFLPRGFLREGLKSLSRADLIVLNHSHDINRFQEIKQKISQYSSAPVIGTRMDVVCVKDLAGRSIDIAHKKVGIFCGIAHPEYFQQTIQSLNAEMVDHYDIPDHMTFDFHSLDVFASRCQEKGAEWILCTEKDRVKLNPSVMGSLPIGWVQSHLRIVHGEDLWQQFIQKVKTTLKRHQ